MNKSADLLVIGIIFSILSACATEDLTDMKKTELLRFVPASSEPSLWLEPDSSRREFNAAFEKTNGFAKGDAVRILGSLLKEETLKPNGGDSNIVSQVLEAILTSGDSSITNVLDHLLFAKTNPWRAMVFCARTGFCGADHRTLAERIVRELPYSERELCYAAAFPFILDISKGMVNRRRLEVTAVLEECAAMETNSLLVSAIDKELATRHNGWKSRNLRKRIAGRHVGANNGAGQYFRSVVAEIGDPLAFTSQDIWENLIDRSFEPNGLTEEQNNKLQHYRNRRFALDFGLTVPETLRLLECLVLDHLKKKNASPEGKEAVSHALRAIYNSKDASSTNMLYEALLAEWNPDRYCTLVCLFRHIDSAAMLKTCRRLLEKKELFSEYERGWCYRKLVEETNRKNNSGLGLQEEVMAFLKDVAVRDEGQNIAFEIDGLLLKADPGWARSEGRKRLAARIAAQTPETPVVTGFKNVLKTIGMPQENGAVP